jgi:uncharacterized protein (TIGR03382 family)
MRAYPHRFAHAAHLAALGAAAVFLPALASAQSWQAIAPGVEYAELDRDGSKVYAARLDLCAPGLRLRATGPGEGPRTVSSYGQLVGANLAINGDWWSVDGEPHLPQTYPRGLAIGDGRHFEGTVDRPHYGVVAFGMNTVLHSPMGEDLGGPHFWMQDVVSGQPTLVWDGAARDNPANHCGVRRARTAVGFNEARDVMLMAVVQEVGGSQGMTCNQTAALMQSLGAHSALNHDGGGSSTMWLAGRGVVNQPTGGQERSLVNHWGVLAPGEGPPRSCTTREVPAPERGVRRQVSPEVMAAWHFEGRDVALMSEESFARYPEGEPVTGGPRYAQHSDGSLWLIDGPRGRETKRHVRSFYAIQTWRMTREPFETGVDAELDALPEGPPLTETPVLVLGPDLTVWLLDSAPHDDDDDGEDDADGADGGADTGGGGDAGVGGGGASGVEMSGGCASAGGGATLPGAVLIWATLWLRRRRQLPSPALTSTYSPRVCRHRLGPQTANGDR